MKAFISSIETLVHLGALCAAYSFVLSTINCQTLAVKTKLKHWYGQVLRCVDIWSTYRTILKASLCEVICVYIYIIILIIELFCLPYILTGWFILNRWSEYSQWNYCSWYRMSSEWKWLLWTTGNSSNTFSLKNRLC